MVNEFTDSGIGEFSVSLCNYKGLLCGDWGRDILRNTSL